VKKSTVLYSLGQSRDFFYDVELLWKSFVFSYHAVEGSCKREGLTCFIDPNNNVYTVTISYVHEEVTHL
jgi:hypothetical protein